VTFQGSIGVDLEQRAVDVEKDLASARASHAEVDAIRVTLDHRSAELAKALEAKGAALQRAEQKIVTLESRVAEQNKARETEREELEALAKLKEQLEAEQAARSFAEGALQAARQERGSRRQDAEGGAPAAPKEPLIPANESARDKITRRRG
jgi:chromosome segregation ATPase